MIRVGLDPLFFVRIPVLRSREEKSVVMSKLTEKIQALAEPIVREEGCSLWDVEYVREAGSWYLRLYIDKEGGVGIDDCERISRRLDPILDEADPIPESYVFEVGSAGAERQLKRPSDFTQFMGSEVEVKLYQPIDGRKAWVGELAGYEDGDVLLRSGGTQTRFPKSQVAQVRLHVTF